MYSFMFGLEMFYDKGKHKLMFSNLFDEIAENIPKEKVIRLKDIIESKM